MVKVDRPRELNAAERTLLEFMLSRDFSGRDALREQAKLAKVEAECECGCGTVDFVVAANATKAIVNEPIPVEANRQAMDVLSFVRNGILSSLEIVDYLDQRPLSYPSPEGLELQIKSSTTE
jgi:hypothetical protein